jgi:hypothetical protein
VNDVTVDTIRKFKAKRNKQKGAKKTKTEQEAQEDILNSQIRDFVKNKMPAMSECMPDIMKDKWKDLGIFKG